MSDLDLVGLRKIAEAATPGPWEADGSKYPGPDDALFIVPVGDGGAIAYVQPLWDDAEHIAAFDPPTVLALLDLIAEQQAELAEVRRAVSNYIARTPSDAPGEGAAVGLAIASAILAILDGETDDE